VKKIVVIGGGTGTYTVLQGLKHYKELELSVIVSMMDSGGSNRILRDEFGLLPTSDLRQCIVALSSDASDDLLRLLFTYRYSHGTGIAGMTFGNLFMAALTDIEGSQKKAIEKTCELFDVKGNIIPVTFDDVHLLASYEDGSKILGEHYIDEPKEKWWKQHIVKLETIPEAMANPEALKAIENADLIIMGPGDLYTSVISNLVVGSIGEAIRNSKAKKLYIMNLMTKPGQTHKFKASDHLKALEKCMGIVDYCLVSLPFKFPRGLLARYKRLESYPVKLDRENIISTKIVEKEIVSTEVHERHAKDGLLRSYIRHDSEKLATAIQKLL
jgi:uncharacterized cofD-like protein